MGEEINFGLGLGFAESKTTGLGLGLGFGKVHYPAKYSAESRTRYTPTVCLKYICNQENSRHLFKSAPWEKTKIA